MRLVKFQTLGAKASRFGGSLSILKTYMRLLELAAIRRGRVYQFVADQTHVLCLTHVGVTQHPLKHFWSCVGGGPAVVADVFQSSEANLIASGSLNCVDHFNGL